MRRHSAPWPLTYRKSFRQEILRRRTRLRPKSARFFVVRRHSQLISVIDVMNHTPKTAKKRRHRSDGRFWVAGSYQRQIRTRAWRWMRWRNDLSTKEL